MTSRMARPSATAETRRAEHRSGRSARIEVLRGPQGTLYGANSMGGLVKYVTVDPDMSRLHGRVQAGTNFIQDGSSESCSPRASECAAQRTFAVRVSGYTRAEPGYIDNPVLGLEDVNRSDATGGRVSALARNGRRRRTFSLKLGALYDRVTADGSSEATDIGDLEQNFIPGTGGYERTVQAYSIIAERKSRPLRSRFAHRLQPERQSELLRLECFVR